MVKNGKKQRNMPAKSKKMKIAACLALAAKDGKVPVRRLRGAALDMYKSMSRSQLEDYCKLPIKK